MFESVVNKRAHFDYEILEKFSAGIEFTGHEVKSAKMGHLNLTGSYAIIRGGEVFLVGSQIASFQPKNAPQNYDSLRTRKLFLKKQEIKYLAEKIKQGLNLIPLKCFFQKNFLKIELGLGRSKKKQDKREAIKKRETEREIRRFAKTKK